MKEETRIEIKLDTDNTEMMVWLKKEVKRYLHKIENLYEEPGVWNVEIVPLSFSRGELDWREVEK